MGKNTKYVIINIETRSIEFTNELIEKYKFIKKIEQQEEVLQELNELFCGANKFLIGRINNQIEKAIDSLPNKTNYYIDGKLVIPNNLMPIKLLDNYLINQINHFFKKELNEFKDFEEFTKETENEETAFYINLNSLITDYHKNTVKTHPKPNEILQSYNEAYYDLTTDKNLVRKLFKDKKNQYLKHLKKSVNYLQIKATAHNPKQNELIIPETELPKLQQKLSGILWNENITSEDFFSFWRLGKKSNYLPIKDGMQTAFVFLLYGYYIESVNVKPKFTQTQLEEAFNLNNIKSLKQGIRSTTPTIKKVKELIGQPKFSLKKQQG